MKFYIAARSGAKEEVRKIYELIKEKNHEVTVDWTLCPALKPYKENKAMSREFAIRDIQGVRDSDIFVLISDRAGTGIYVELGTAISSFLDRGKPKVYVIGDYLDNLMFYFYPIVNRRDNIEQVLNECEAFT